ncbi:MAG TPA: serine/threonine-protein kinase [Polyangiaceae bacterium]|nr:serine/threonine-protein kinase [Polyangiaceae bacterium]
MGVRAQHRPEHRLVLGEFAVSSVLGEGGSGVVYAASSDRHGEIALKVLHENLALSERERRRFLEESERMRRVRHPSLVPMIDAGVLPDGRPYLAMPLLRGESLAERVGRGALPLAAALARFGEIAEGATALHDAGLVHRDVKPENVFLDETSGRAILLDFGIARDLGGPTTTTTRAGAIRGTPAYMAPERFFGTPASIASDVYELAVVFYMMLVGRLPWDAEHDASARLHPKTPRDQGIELPAGLVSVLMGALSTRPEARPRGADAFAKAVREACLADGGGPPDTADLGAPPRARSGLTLEAPRTVRAPGEVVGGRFRLERLIGRGGMAEVWAATHTLIHKPVALKFLNASLAIDEPHRRRFVREARAAATVRHPHVVQIHDVIELEGGVPVMVMDLLEGESLGQRLERVRVLTFQQTAEIVLPVISALEAAHGRGIVHRDLKPDNIFLATSDDGGQRVVVLDFGIAKVAPAFGTTESAVHTADGAMLGTPLYMSPEQIYGEPDVDPLCDVWSLGVILYECLTGYRPIQGATLGQVLKAVTNHQIVPIERHRPDLPPHVAALVTRMLSTRREDRPPSMGAVRAGLLEVRGGGPSSRRWTRPAALVGVVTMGAATLAAAVLGSGHSAPALSVMQARVVPAASAMAEPSTRLGTLAPSSSAPIETVASATAPHPHAQPHDRSHDVRPAPSIAPVTTGERLDSGVWNRPPF